MGSSDRVQTKLAAARTRLILEKPFLGALVLRLPLVEADPQWCPSVATDARALYYNPEYVGSLPLEQLQFALAHEALHCALSHFARREHRVRHRWDLACDLAINPLLVKEGLSPAPGALIIPDFEGMSAEEIYPLIKDDQEEGHEPFDRHLYEGGGQGEQDRPAPEPQEAPRPDERQGREGRRPAGRPPPLSPQEREQLAERWRRYLAGAAQQALQAGKLAGALARMVDRLLAPQVPWRSLLARYLVARARDDYTYTRPSRREGQAILPALRGHEMDLVVALDTSGSVTDEEIRAFASELDAIKGQVRARLTLLACDWDLAPEGPWRYEPWEPLTLPRSLRGGGGTRFRPVFDWVEREGLRPDVLVYFTDAQGEFPPREPPYPVIWLVKGGAQVPWGIRVQLN
ncbi:MAG TPA: hypothetical protein ENK20_10375 [Chromatiales bacterium]|nr:hypothetical protein [Chromatiales bacterium]